MGAAPLFRSSPAKPSSTWFLPASDSRLSELDTLRAIAALMVLVMHWTHWYGVVHGTPGLIPFTFGPGGFGVHLFFVISGFVIMMTIERAKHTVEFVRARFFRLYPTFWFCMLFTAAVSWIFGPPERQHTLTTIAANLTMVPSWLGVAAVDGVYWTLAVELVFYAWMAILAATGLLANPSRRARVTLGWVTAAVAVGLVARALPKEIVDSQAFEIAKHGALLPWIGMFGAGVVLLDTSRNGGKVTWEGWVLLAMASANQLVWGSKTGAIVTVVSAVAVWCAANLRPRVMRFRPLVWIGAVSYPVYLLHMNLGFSMLWNAQIRNVPFSIVYPIAFAVVVALASAVHVLIEKPTSRLFKRAPRAS